MSRYKCNYFRLSIDPLIEVIVNRKCLMLIVILSLWLMFLPLALTASSANYATNRANRERSKPPGAKSYTSNVVEAYGETKADAYLNAKRKIPEGSQEKSSDTVQTTGNQYLCRITYITPK